MSDAPRIVVGARLATSRRTAPPKASRIARRRFMVGSTKRLLPICALLLLGVVAAWPELDRASNAGRVAFRRTFGLDPDAARLTEPHYHGLDARGRPYTITADSAQQVGSQQVGAQQAGAQQAGAGEGNERVNLVEPRGDVTTESGGWLYVRAKEGVYAQHAGQLDLSHDVVMYRDDGTTVYSQTATIDLKTGAASTDSQTHAEGSFGTLDAQGYTLVDKGAVIQFTGPARLLLNQGRR